MEDGELRAVDDLSYYVNKGESVGLVGESACGKSVSALSIMRLIPYPPGIIVGGEVIFKDEDLLQVSEEKMRHIRGNRIAMIFQEPTTSLNPVVDRQRKWILLTGDVPSPINPPSGCHFHPRCDRVIDDCKEHEPELKNRGGEHWVACHKV